MPPATSDPEKYSIDEMMERLKAKPSGNPAEGELVTREDGTQAIKVRKRKRRTDQPKKEEAKRLRRLRIIQVYASLSLLILFSLFVGGAFVYTNTPAYRNAMSNAVAGAIGGSAEFKGFRVTPVSANAESVDLNWPESNCLKSISLRSVTSKLSPLSPFGTSFQGEEVVAHEGKVFLQLPSRPGPSAPPTGPVGTKPIRFERISVTKLDLTAGDRAQPAFKLTSSETAPCDAVLHFDENKSTCSLKIHRGNLAIAQWPVFQVDNALVQIQPNGVDLIGLRINDSLTPRGLLELSGPLNPFDPAQKSTLKVNLENFNLADLLGQELGKLLDARIDTRQLGNSNYLSFTDSLASTELAIAFKCSLTSQVTVSGFPFLLRLASILDDDSYKQPNLDDSVGTIVRKGATLELRDLSFGDRRNRMAIKGNLTVAAATADDPDKVLSGSLEIGILESVVQLSPILKVDSLFSPVRNGFRWLTLTIGGSLAHPTDNFTEVYAAAKDPPTAGDSDPGKAFDDLTKPGERWLFSPIRTLRCFFGGNPPNPALESLAGGESPQRLFHPILTNQTPCKLPTSTCQSRSLCATSK